MTEGDTKRQEQDGPDQGSVGTCNDAARREAVWRAVASVTDPEIPVLSIVDLGIIAGVHISGSSVVVDVTPTFVGCPALDMIRDEIRSAVERTGENDVTVNTVFDPPWTSDRVTETGRRKLKEFGLAPPLPSTCGGQHARAFSLGMPPAQSGVPSIETVPCPYCDSTETVLESLFGPTLCRSIHYCNKCLQSFEHFKTVDL